jgi:nickel/cobalt exporter
MKRLLLWRLAAASTTALVLALSLQVVTGGRPASAHPLGNFTINRYVRIDLSPEAVRLRYVLDVAEIPAYQELQAAGISPEVAASGRLPESYARRKAADLLRNLELEVGGRRLPLTVVAQAAWAPEGQAGLRTVRVEADYEGSLPDGWQRGAEARFRDRNFEGRLGWSEVVVRGGSGVVLTSSDVPAADRTAELTAYPADALASPTAVREARFAFAVGSAGSDVASSGPAPAALSAREEARGGFAALILAPRLGAGLVLLSLLAAAAWGAAHALGPGHGKTIVAAYLVGSRGTLRHALVLALTVTLTHTASVVALGLVALYAARHVDTAEVYLWLSVASGLFVMAIGLALLLGRARGLRRRPHGHSHDVRGGDHGHSHDQVPSSAGLRGLIALGISGGLLPCPTALVVMLASVAVGRVAFGLLLILSFSVGLAATLTAVGLALVYAGRVIEGKAGRGPRVWRVPLAAKALGLLPLGSAGIILVFGALLTGQALSAL